MYKSEGGGGGGGEEGSREGNPVVFCVMFQECLVLRESNINLTKCCDGLQRSLAHHMACLSATAALRTMHAEEVSELKIR